MDALNKIMDALAAETQKTKVLIEKLKNASCNIAKLEEERPLVKGCTSEINQCVLRIIESGDSLFIVFVRQNLFEKLQHVFATMNQLQGVSGSEAFTKQGGDEEECLTKLSDWKDNEAFGSGKDNGKGVSEEENDENLMMSESERIAREKTDKDFEELNALRKKLEENEVEAMNLKLILETQKSLFPAWFRDVYRKKPLMI